MKLMYIMSHAEKYISVTMYDAEKKKNITRTLSKSRFKTEKALKNHIDKLKETQREKNRVYKEATAADIYEEKLENQKNNNSSIKQIADNKMYTNTITNIDNFILDPETGNSTAIFGASKRGKTTLMMKLYEKYYAHDKKFISTLFAGNKQIKAYKGCKNLLLGDGFSKQSENYIKMQKYLNMHTKNKYKFLNMFDDIIDTKYKALVNNLILTYRNSNISTIMCLQYPYLLSKMNRANVNNVFIFGCNLPAEKKDMIDVFLKDHFLNLGLSTLKDQINFFDEVTSNYGFFYINNLKGRFTIHRILN